MTKLTVLSPITHDDKDYKPGDKFEGNKEVVAALITAGALEDPDRVKTVQEESELGDAKAQAKELIEAAEKRVTDATAEADAIIEAARTQAKETVANAEEHAASLVAAAEQSAKTKPNTSTK